MDWALFIEIPLMFAVFYFILRTMRGTRGAGIVRGVFFLAVVVVLGVVWAADFFRLDRISVILETVGKATILALIIIFQPELRRALLRIGQAPILRPFLPGKSQLLEELVKATVRLSKGKIGALIALERDIGLDNYVEQGIQLDAEVRAELLESIFRPPSPLHDGAVVIKGDRVAAAGCLFPLTENPEVSKTLGTRHRAGIGITEGHDAVTIIVSEETGNISVGVRGHLTRDMDREKLTSLLRELYLGAVGSTDGRAAGGAEGEN